MDMFDALRPLEPGKLFEHELEILPTREGGFIVTLGDNFRRQEKGGSDLASVRDRWAFTDVMDLMAWLDAHARALVDGTPRGRPSEARHGRALNDPATMTVTEIADHARGGIGA